MAVDATKRKLEMPAWQIPYLEKHRIIELYRELVRELVINQPVDHVLFIKQLLSNAYGASKVSRVIILCSPKVNCLEVAHRIAEVTGQKVITEGDVLHALGLKTWKRVRPDMLAQALLKLTRTDNAYQMGWIMVDVLKTAKEAKRMLAVGILPTHVLHLIPPFSLPLTEILYCDVLPEWPDYRRNMFEIREVLKDKLVEVFLGSGLIHEVVSKCVTLINIRDGHGGPAWPRVLILGPRGSGRKTQAKLLEANLDLVHVDFEYILCQAWISDTKLGEKLRACRDEVCYKSDLLCEVLDKRLKEHDCMTKGWVLTNFPFTHIDFKYLDTLDTPPNRVIFLEIDPNICRERLINRRVNAFTGSSTNLAEEPNSVWYKHLNTHPKDRLAMINAELAYYCEQYGQMRTYCGGTATVINGDQPKRWVYESIVATIVRATPPVPPRDPCIDVKEELKAMPPPVDESTTSTDTTSSSSVPSQLFGSFISAELAEKAAKKQAKAAKKWAKKAKKIQCACDKK